MSTKSTTQTSLKVIPAGWRIQFENVLADTWRDLSTHNVFRGEEFEQGHAYGVVSHPRTAGLAPGAVIGWHQPPVFSTACALLSRPVKLKSGAIDHPSPWPGFARPRRDIFMSLSVRSPSIPHHGTSCFRLQP